MICYRELAKHNHGPFPLSFFCALLLNLSTGACQTSPRAEPQGPLQLVESYPVETNLQDPLLPKTAEVWMHLITQAQSSLDLSFFYISNEPKEALEPILDAIKHAAERGVQVRFLFDQLFLKKYADTMGRDAERLKSWPRTEVRVVTRWDQGRGVQHNKYILADRERSYIGSANFDWRALKHIQELGYASSNLRLVGALQDIFDEDWQKAETSDLSQNLDPSQFSAETWQEAGETAQAFLRVSPPPQQAKEQLWDLPVLLDWIDQAESEIFITTKDYFTRYFSTKETWFEFEDRLIQAKKRGVRVRMLIEDKGRIEKFRRLLEHQVEVCHVLIPEHSSGPIPYARMIHAKTMLVDSEKLWLGSGNIGPDSFFEDRNISLFIVSKSYAAQLQRVLERYWQSPYRSPLTIP